MNLYYNILTTIMYKLYIFVGLIAVINAQLITISQKEIIHAAGMSIEDQTDYIKEAMKGKLTKCIFTCIRNGCGKTYRTHACLFNWKVRFDCNESCYQSSIYAKQAWTKESNDLRTNCINTCRTENAVQNINVILDCYNTRCNTTHGFQ
jgi:hypothetical protein